MEEYVDEVIIHGMQQTNTRETGGFVLRPKAVKQRKHEMLLFSFANLCKAQGFQSKQ